MIKIFILILLGCYSVIGYCQMNVAQKVYIDFEYAGISKNDADIILNEVANSFSTVQEYISEIASKSESIKEKINLKYKTLNFFTSSKSIIEVTSLNSNETKRRFISDYLDRLMNLPYYRVTIYWDRNLSISKLFKNDSGNYELGIGCWQYFVSRNQEGMIIIKDKTYKKSFFTITKDYSSNWTVKINEIKAEETKTFNINADY